MTRMRIIGLVLAALVLCAGPALAEPRIALIIGNSEYGGTLGELPNPANDARLMAKTLKGIGFEVIEAENADQAQMKRAIQDFGAKLADAGAESTGLFFYAGHGLQVAGTNYLIPIKAKIENERDVDIEAVPVDLVMKQMAFAGSAVNIVILDACRNNPLSRGFRAIIQGLADPTIRPEGSFIAYSTAPGDVADDGKGTNSPFTKALAESIIKPGATINDVFQDVRGKVRTATNKKQVPWDSSSLTAPFYFVPAVAVAAAAAPTSNAIDPKAIELAFWDAIKDSKSAEDYQAYLEKFPAGDFAPLAEIRLKQAGQTVTRVVPQGGAVAVPAGSGEPEAAQFEQAFWSSAHEGDSPEDYQAYLKKYPNGLFAAEARDRLAESSKGTQQAALAAPPKPLPAIVATTAKLYAKNKARLRDAPASEGAVLAQLPAGAPLDATGRSADGAWWRVTSADGRSGFVAASVVDTQSPPPPTAAVAPAPATLPAPVTAKPAAPAADPETTATVVAGKEHDTCLEGADRPSAERAVACRRLLAAGVADETDRYNAELRFGDALAELGKNEEAMQAYRAAVAIDPNFFGAYYSIGVMHLNAGRYGEARTALDKSIALNPEDANAVYQRGTVLANLGDFDRARPDVERAIKLKADDVSYYDQLAAIDLAQGDAEAAVAAVEHGVAVAPDYYGGAAILAYYLVGKRDRSLAMAEAGIKDSPDYPYFYIWKVLVLKAAHDDAAAATTLDEGMRALGKPDWPVPLMDYLAGRVSETKLRALAASSDAKVQAERLCEIGFYTGEVAYIAGDTARAKAGLQTAISSRVYRYLEFVAAKARLAQLQ
jgi:tetratricopeptide (TPR) repeat protein